MSKSLSMPEKLFGKAPKKGYKFTFTEVTLVDNERFKGFSVQWSAKGIGFGECYFGWGLTEELKQYNQHGFHLSTECMSDEFIAALLKKIQPQLLTILLSGRRD